MGDFNRQQPGELDRLYGIAGWQQTCTVGGENWCLASCNALITDKAEANINTMATAAGVMAATGRGTV